MGREELENELIKLGYEREDLKNMSDIDLKIEYSTAHEEEGEIPDEEISITDMKERLIAEAGYTEDDFIDASDDDIRGTYYREFEDDI